MSSDELMMPYVATYFLHPKCGAELYMFCYRNVGVVVLLLLKHCLLLLTTFSVRSTAQTRHAFSFEQFFQNICHKGNEGCSYCVFPTSVCDIKLQERILYLRHATFCIFVILIAAQPIRRRWLNLYFETKYMLCTFYSIII